MHNNLRSELLPPLKGEGNRRSRRWWRGRTPDICAVSWKTLDLLIYRSILCRNPQSSRKISAKLRYMEFLYQINFKRQKSRIFPMTLILYAVCLIWWLKENGVRNILKMWLKIFCPMVARKSYHFPKNLMIRYLWHNHCHKNLQIS